MSEEMKNSFTKWLVKEFGPYYAERNGRMSQQLYTAFCLGVEWADQKQKDKEKEQIRLAALEDGQSLGGVR